MTGTADDRKAAASGWFRELRDRIVAAFEALEDAGAPGPFAELPAGRFEVTPTARAADDGSDAGGGIMSVMRGGRVFEKVGVNWSQVHGTLGERAQKAMAARGVPGMAEDPRFWASGISLVAHMRNPHVPAVHMNTRMFWTPHAWWFGGGADLNPCLEYAEDTAHFHGRMKAACDAHGPLDGEDRYDKLKAWADDYFFVPHRGRARGVGGIFYDDLNTGDWDADLAFTRDVGAHFLPAFRAAGGASSCRPLDRCRQGRAAGPSRALCGIQSRLRPGHEVRAGIGARRQRGADVAAARGEVALSYSAAVALASVQTPRKSVA